MLLLVQNSGTLWVKLMSLVYIYVFVLFCNIWSLYHKCFFYYKIIGRKGTTPIWYPSSVCLPWLLMTSSLTHLQKKAILLNCIRALRIALCCDFMTVYKLSLRAECFTWNTKQCCRGSFKMTVNVQAPRSFSISQLWCGRQNLMQKLSRIISAK
jgi:hypothetical protein